jgi:hypothetical protein
VGRTDTIKKIHIQKFSSIAIEVRRKLGNQDKIIQEEYFKVQCEILLTLLKRNLSSDNNLHQLNISALVEVYIEKFQKEAHFLPFFNMLDFQDCVPLLFAFFLKIVNNYHKQFLDFCKEFGG